MRRGRHFGFFLLFLSLCSAAGAMKIEKKIAERRLFSGDLEKSHFTGTRIDIGEADFQIAAFECEWFLSVAPLINAQFTAKNGIPYELMTTDFVPPTNILGHHAVFPSFKENWILAGDNLHHFTPWTYPVSTNIDDRSEHLRLIRALVAFYQNFYDDEQLLSIVKNEKEIPRQRKKIAVVRQSPQHQTIYDHTPDHESVYLATSALYDATDDIKGPRPGDRPGDFRSPVERMFQRESRAPEILKFLSDFRATNRGVPIFEWGNFIVQCGDSVDQILCAFLLHGWTVHQYLKYHANGYLILHTLKESTTRIFEERFNFHRRKGDRIFSAGGGEHVFFIPIAHAIPALFAWQKKKVDYLSRKLPGFVSYYDEAQRKFELNIFRRLLNP